MRNFFIICICFLFLIGCSSKDDSKINSMKAKELIINESAILVDVRTEEEYNEKHIEGAILYTLDNINENTIKDIIPDKDRPIILYCASGNRSNQAYEIITSLGYEKVYDLGAMSNWK